MTESGEAIINSDKNVLIKYDILGNRKWISPSLSGDLIKIQRDFVIKLEYTSNTLIYIDITTGQIHQSVSCGKFNEGQLPQMRTSETVFAMYSSQSICWIECQPDTKVLSAGRYVFKDNYEILSVSVDKEGEIHLILQHKKNHQCLAIIDEGDIKLQRCRLMAYNQRSVIHSTQNGFIIQSFKDNVDQVIRLVFFGQSEPEEEIFRARETILSIQTFEQNEIVVLRYLNYSEICRFTSFDLICADIFIRKRVHQMFPTRNQASLLLLTDLQAEEEKGYLKLELFDLEKYKVIEFGRISFKEHLLFFHAVTSLGHEKKSTCVHIIVQTQTKRIIFATAYAKQLITHFQNEGSLQGSLPPLFYRFPNILDNPYPKCKSAKLSPSLQMIQIIWSNLRHRWQSDFQQISHILQAFNLEPIRIGWNYMTNLVLGIIGEQPQFPLKTHLFPSWKTYQFNQQTDKEYGIEQLLLIATKQFQLFTFNSKSGELIYNKQIEAEQNTSQVIGLVRIAKDKQISIEYGTNNQDDYVIIISKDDSMIFQFLSPETGVIIKDFKMTFKNKERYQSYIKSRLISNSKKEHLILFTHKMNVAFFPTLNEEEYTQLKERLSKQQVFAIHQEQGEILIFELKYSSPGFSLVQKSSFPLKINQRIVKVVQNQDFVDVSSKTRELVAVESEGKDTYRWLDLENRIFVVLAMSKADKKLTVYVVDAASSMLLFERFLSNVRTNQPIDILLHENSILISFFSDYYSKQTIFQMKIYFREFLTIFSLPSPTLSLDKVICEVKTLFSDQTISKMHAIISNNIAQENTLLLTNHQHDILLLNLQELQQTASTILNNTYSKVNTQPLTQVDKIYVEKTLLSSTYLLLAEGAQIYSAQFTPSGKYDHLPFDFNYPAVIASSLLTFILLLIAIIYHNIRKITYKKTEF